MRGENLEKAVDYGVAAGDRARELGIYVGAVDYYEQVLALSGIAEATKQQVTERLADVLALQEDYVAAKSAYLQAIELGSLTARDKFEKLSNPPGQ